MRLIGHLPNESAANTFGSFLSSQGIGNETEAAQEGWEVWIHSEDQWRKAKELLAEFIANPAAPKYTIKLSPASSAAAAPQITVELKRRSGENPNAPTDQPARIYAAGALTLVFVALCLVVQVLREVGYEEGVLRELFMTEIVTDGAKLRWNPGLSEIKQGEFWRLFTPILVHGGWLHFLMNMLWLLDLGSRIESREGTGRLGLLVVLIGVVSNLGQNALFDASFCGMSGVIYGLLAYVWVKGRLDPASGLQVQQNTAVMLLVWFFVCLANLIPNVANGSHAAGLMAGAVLGVLFSLRERRRRVSA